MWLVDELGHTHRHIEAGGQFGDLDTFAFRAMKPDGKVTVIDDNHTLVGEFHERFAIFGACRLGDVIAALQVLAYYKFYKLDVDKWAERITGDTADAASLETVFRDHPEFFQRTTGANGAKAALVARRSFTRSYDVDAAREIPKDEATARRRDPDAWGRLSRRPLTPEETAVLIGTAIDMHSQAVEQRKAGRWWVPLAIAGIGLVGGIASTVAGVLIGALL